MERFSPYLLALAGVGLAVFVLVTVPSPPPEESPGPVADLETPSRAPVEVQSQAPLAAPSMDEPGPSAGSVTVAGAPGLADVPESVVGVLSAAGLAEVAGRSTELTDLPASVVDVLMGDDVVLVVPQSPGTSP